VHTMDKLAQALPEDGRAQQLAIVRNAHEETLREHGHGPAVDPGKTYVDLIMKGIEFLLAELFNTGQKELDPLGVEEAKGRTGRRTGMGATEAHVNFDAPAILRKWPSRNNQRCTEGTGPYLLVDGTLDECIREFMAKPASVRHLYEIHTSPQPPLVNAVLSVEHVVELARLRDFL